MSRMLTLQPKPVARPEAIVDARDAVNSTDDPSKALPPGSMSYTCRICIQRKVKCDKVFPTCSSCSKAKLACVYQAPMPRQRKRKRPENVQERLERYERTLRDNGLPTTSRPRTTPSHRGAVSSSDPPEPDLDVKQATTNSGRLFSDKSKTRYIASSLWRDLGEEDMRDISDHEDNSGNGCESDHHSVELDPLSGALLGVSRNLDGCQPTHTDAMKLWTVYLENVEPLCKVLHIPTMSGVVRSVSQHPFTATKPQQCLCFAIYHFAILSMSEQDCLLEFKQSRASLKSRYHFAVRLALVNASWLKTIRSEVLQALVLFLIAIRGHTDITTYWIFTGVAVRIAQRMGIHRDGEALGLSTFDVEMRRRLFWQLLPLDGYAGGVSGTGISLAPSSWNTKRPSNINDGDIYPGMTEKVHERTGATEMIFCLAKNELSNFYNYSGVKLRDDGAAVMFRDGAETERLIDEVQDTIEAKYLRYCDILNPVHILTSGMTRAAANSARVRNRISAVVNGNIENEERREVCRLAYRVVDADIAAYGNEELRRFQWKMESFSTWEALICILNCLLKLEFFTRDEVDAAWERLTAVYTNHPEIIEAKEALRLAVSRLTLNAWTSNPPALSQPEPEYIASLHRRAFLQKSRHHTVPQGEQLTEQLLSAHVAQSDPTVDSAAPSDDLDWSNIDAIDIEEVDWAFWDGLIRDYKFMPGS